MARKRTTVNNLVAKKIGNWDGATKFFASMGKDVSKAADKALWDISKRLRDIVVGHILNQDLDWQTLSPKTVKNKKGKNQNKILIDTGRYVENIKVWRAGGTVNVGVKRGIMYRRKSKGGGSNTVSLVQVARWNEFGTSGTHGVPARPVWKPSMDELGGQKGIRSFVAAAIHKRLQYLNRRSNNPVYLTKSQISKLF